MGGKRKIKNQDDDFPDNATGNHKTYQSEVSKALAEEQEAKKRELLNTDEPDTNEQSKKSKRKQKKNQAREDDDAEFTMTEDVPKAGKKDAAKKDVEEEKEMADDLDDMDFGKKKKNKKNKKNNESSAATESIDAGEKGKELIAAMGEDSEEESSYLNKRRKGGNKKNKDKYEHKGKKKNQDDAEEENAEEPVTKQDDDKDQIDTTTATENEKLALEEAMDTELFSGPPLVVIYCEKCGIPPEYCELISKDKEDCKALLQESYPQLFKQLYGESTVKKTKKQEKKEAKVDAGDKDGQITENKEAVEGEEGEEPKEKKVKVKKGKADGTIRIYKFHRGKKTECKLIGFEYYTKDLKDVASKFGKKFCCGSSVINDEKLGECINIQGDVENNDVDLWEYLGEDKHMQKLKIDTDKIVFEDMGNKKGRKRAV